MKPQALILAAALAAGPAYATEIFDAPGGGISCLGDNDLGVHPEYGVFCTLAGRTRFAATKTMPPLPTPPTPNTANRVRCSSCAKPAVPACFAPSPDHPDGLGLLGKIKGETVSGDGWRCRVNPSGIVCTNQSGRGFDISRERQRLF